MTPVGRSNRIHRLSRHTTPQTCEDYTIDRTEGCRIDGLVQNSILSNSVVIEEGATVDYSVVMPVL
jgi:ADP-glucose pyrophosphorylase